jgi:hypothetical protein
VAVRGQEGHLRVAVQNPHRGALAGPRTLQPWAEAFLRRHQPWIYLTSAAELRSYVAWIRRHGLQALGWKVVMTAAVLNRVADVLVCFNGRPDLPENCPARAFRGMKAAHVMDYASWASRAHAALAAAGVDFVLGYADHGRWDGFFRTLYPAYTERVIPVPFAFNARFVNRTPFEERAGKCVALGAVNPVRDPLCAAGELDDYAAYFAAEDYAHKFRRMLRDREAALGDVMRSRLPHPPATKDFGYDIVAEYNAYRMFTTCESIMFYPSVKTYEGCATGSVLVCSDHPCFAELGFVDGENCVMHRQLDVDDFHEKVRAWLGRVDELRKVQEAGTELVRTRYCPDAVADRLHTDLVRRWTGR